MSRTVINVGAVASADNVICKAISAVDSVRNSFSQTRNSIDNKIKNRANINDRLTTVANRLNRIENNTEKIRSAVSFGAEKYQNTDLMVESWKSDVSVKISDKNDKWKKMFS